MKGNKLTPNSNMRWESMRILIPEHREALQAHRQGLKVKTRPILEDCELQRISDAIQRSFLEKVHITLTLFGSVEDSSISGIVGRIDQNGRRLLIGDRWVKFEDIISTYEY